MTAQHQITASNGSKSINTMVDFDPTSPQGYSVVMEAIALLTRCADELDSFFGRRAIEVRNHLRGMGWSGESMGPLVKDGFELSHDFMHIGAGRNVVGVEYIVLGGAPNQISVADDLQQGSLEIAKFIDLCATNEAEKVSRPLTQSAPVGASGQFVG